MLKNKRLDFWFWVKVLVVVFMLAFLIYPFCTLITRSFFSAKTEGVTLATSASLPRNITTRHWGAVSRCPCLPPAPP